MNGGAEVDATFTGSAATVTASGSGPYALADGMTLALRIDNGPEQSLVFSAADFADIAAATATEVAAAINAVIIGGRARTPGGIVQLDSDTEGTASRLQVTGGTANAVLGVPTTAASGVGNVASLRAVTIPEVEAVVVAVIPSVLVEAGSGGGLQIRTVATGASATLQANAATAAAFGFDSALHTGSASGAANAIRVEGKDPGAYANRIEAEVRLATNGSATAFDLFVVEDGVYRESFPNLTMNPDAPRYVERVVNDARTGSILVHVIDQLLAGSPTPPPQTVALVGGSDDLVGLADIDFVGSEAGKTGLHAFDQVQELSVLLVPGRATPTVHAAMISYCETARNGTVFAVLDPPAGLSATGIVTYVAITAGLEGASEFAAIYSTSTPSSRSTAATASSSSGSVAT